MARKETPHPTPRELAILRILWQQGPSTVRQVNEALSQGRSTGYTTTLKLMQIMTEKGLLVRNASKWPHVYRARVGEEHAQDQILERVLERAFGGSAEKLMMRLLAAKRVEPEELARIRRKLDELEREQA
jgi:predicted transcriptional regulator